MKKEEFAKYVAIAMQGDGLAMMRPVVEKELLHYEIFNALDSAGLLKNLVFQGGTSLRLCRGSERFSEDLDFAGGKAFSSQSMHQIKECIVKQIGERFGLAVTVKEPKPPKEGSRVTVDKWEISVVTAPERRDIAQQKIKLEIANVEAYTKELVPLRINYSALVGMSTVMVIAESLNEILADKIVALPRSISKMEEGHLVETPTKIRHRDIWDIAFLIEKGATLEPELVNRKIQDYGAEHFGPQLDFAMKSMEEISASAAFKGQMQRFISQATVKSKIERPGFDAYLASTVNQQLQAMKPQLLNAGIQDRPESLVLQDVQMRTVGRYVGKVLDVSDGLVTQRVARDGSTVVHALAALSAPVDAGAVVDITYVDGVGVVGGKAIAQGK